MDSTVDSVIFSKDEDLSEEDLALEDSSLEQPQAGFLNNPDF